MTARKHFMWLLIALLQIALLMKLFSVSVSMPMTMDDMMASHHSANSSSSSNQNNHTTMPCCDVIGSPCMSSIFMLSHLIEIALLGDGEKIANLNFNPELILIQNISPPPKI